MARAQAGWYPDPSGTPGQRYFDGTTWTQWTCAADRGSAPQVRSDQQRGIDALRRGEAGDLVGAVRDSKTGCTRLYIGRWSPSRWWGWVLRRAPSGRWRSAQAAEASPVPA